MQKVRKKIKPRKREEGMRGHCLIISVTTVDDNDDDGDAGGNGVMVRCPSVGMWILRLVGWVACVRAGGAESVEA